MKTILIVILVSCLACMVNAQTLLPSRTFVAGTNLGYAYYTNAYSNANSNGNFSGSILTLNANVGYLLSSNFKIGVDFNKNYSDNLSETQYGISLTKYFPVGRIAPFVSLSSLLVNGDVQDSYIETKYSGYSFILSTGVAFSIVKNVYLQGTFNILAYQDFKYDYNDTKETYFLIGINQPVSIGLFYNFTK